MAQNSIFKPKPEENIIKDLSSLSKEDLNYLLLKSSENCRINDIKLLLKAGVDVNCIDNTGWTALMYASLNAYNTKIIKILLDAGAYVNTKNINGRTALMYATKYNYIKTVKLLLKTGADANIKDNAESTALNWAFERQHYDVYKILIDAGATM